MWLERPGEQASSRLTGDLFEAAENKKTILGLCIADLTLAISRLLQIWWYNPTELPTR
jgi:hypothetical protein